ncbi:hypothetical protein HYFRA_00013763 [Hymenoscyphus fraxineus]|uniref:DUF7730 domain-containing protein n=1 Tax=Hymenoscyphus fraxineus TaxID=746836 RepID=A0A9N9LD57_9HELO|nr:hypothetical protein HYFRA_00013763 [Hymenoscyphus fraxineus]
MGSQRYHEACITCPPQNCHDDYHRDKFQATEICTSMNEGMSREIPTKKINSKDILKFQKPFAMPSPCTVLHRFQNISPQRNCSLLSRLSLELRRKIYEELFADQARKWHLSRPTEIIQIRGSRESEIVEKQTWCTVACLEGHELYRPDISHQKCFSNRGCFADPAVSPRIEMAFLFTCRQASYNETSPMLYGRIVFGIESPLALRRLVTTLSPTTLNSITSIDLVWSMEPTQSPALHAFLRRHREQNEQIALVPSDYDYSVCPQPQTSDAALLGYRRTWETLKEMKGLKTLRVKFTDVWPSFGRIRDYEHTWLDLPPEFAELDDLTLAVPEPFFRDFERLRRVRGLDIRILDTGDGTPDSECRYAGERRIPLPFGSFPFTV